MKFGSLLGNADLKRRLASSFDSGRASHCYLLYGPYGSGKHTLAELLSAAFLCVSETERPCLHCEQCGKVLRHTHPDVITVDDSDRKTLSVERIRQARSDAFIRPNEGCRKIYIIPRAQDMNPSGQNALLKILEEPPAYGVFLLLSDRAEKLLPTVRSRCVELRLSPVERSLALPFLRDRLPETDDEARSAAYLRAGGYLGQALSLLSQNADHTASYQFAKAYAAHDAAAICSILSPMEKFKREQLILLLQDWRQLLLDALSHKSGVPALSTHAAEINRTRTASELLHACEVLREALLSADCNVGVGHICGWLSVQLR